MWYQTLGSQTVAILGEAHQRMQPANFMYSVMSSAPSNVLNTQAFNEFEPLQSQSTEALVSKHSLTNFNAVHGYLHCPDPDTYLAQRLTDWDLDNLCLADINPKVTGVTLQRLSR
jgi:hypothetical protein